MPPADRERTHLNQVWRDVANLDELRTAIDQRLALVNAGHDRRRAKEMEETARRHEERYKATSIELTAFTEGLSAAQQAELKQAASRWRREEEERKRLEVERLRQQREKAERERKRKREALRERERALVERLKIATPLAFASADVATRRKCWQLMLGHDELFEALQRMDTSGFFDNAGYLRDAGRRAVVSAADHTASKSPRPREPKAPAAHRPLYTEPRGPGM
ncbi:hypothetical protein R3F64_15670 [Halomonas sp. 5021]|uniref:hypothetical protein n=1 Tax=Halomonas sp. 5021 TaxID=3082156 RepID=UPI002FCC97C7